MVQPLGKLLVFDLKHPSLLEASRKANLFTASPMENGKGEATSLAGPAIDPDPAALMLNEPLGDGKPKSNALPSLPGGPAHLIKLVKNRCLPILGDIDAGVSNGNF